MGGIGPRNITVSRRVQVAPSTLAATHDIVNKVGLDDVDVHQLVPAVLSQLDARLWRRGHDALLGLNVSSLLIICQFVPVGNGLVLEF